LLDLTRTSCLHSDVKLDEDEEEDED